MSTNFYLCLVQGHCVPGSSVGIATGYGLDGPGIEFWGSEIFRTCPDRPCTMGKRSFLGKKSGRVMTLTTQLLVVPWP